MSVGTSSRTSRWARSGASARRRPAGRRVGKGPEAPGKPNRVRDEQPRRERNRSCGTGQGTGEPATSTLQRRTAVGGGAGRRDEAGESAEARGTRRADGQVRRSSDAGRGQRRPSGGRRRHTRGGGTDGREGRIEPAGRGASARRLAPRDVPPRAPSSRPTSARHSPRVTPTASTKGRSTSSPPAVATSTATPTSSTSDTSPSPATSTTGSRSTR